MPVETFPRFPSVYEERQKIYLAPETQLTRQIDISLSLYYLEDNRG